MCSLILILLFLLIIFLFSLFYLIFVFIVRYYGLTCRLYANNITCADVPCLNDGTCTVVDSDGYNCTCPAAFIGNQCEVEIDPPCAENHYGPDCESCIDQDLCSGHYQCDENGAKICLDNWEGL